MQVLADVYSAVENYSLFIQIKRKLEYKAEILKRRHMFESRRNNLQTKILFLFLHVNNIFKTRKVCILLPFSILESVITLQIYYQVIQGASSLDEALRSFQF